ncbi:DUF4817 domain-containing protein [Nephila pilipes]|uniref:DUF4817 domain-containing protein n=1 Tax=Nephila pilipes TaxID=299642 RepID=A0A8X6QLG6_NEPPI|nr:DUF4817 domain-containing protein [Nephila pilipes]
MGCLCKYKSPERLTPSQEVTDRVCTGFQRSQRKSTRRVSREVQISQSVDFKKDAKVIPFKVLVLQNLSDMDEQKRFEFCVDMQLRFENGDFASRLVFTEEATFHINMKVNKQNDRFGGTENPKFPEQHV